MSNRQTGIGLDFRRGKGAVELFDALERNNGNMVHTAFELNISRRHLYRLVDRANLRDKLDTLREPEWLRRARLEMES